MPAAALHIEPATPEDVDVLLRIERECSPHPWTRDQLTDAAAPGGTGTMLVLRGERASDPEIVGYCAYQVVLDELHVHNLAVWPAARRRGHARRLLAACFEDGHRRGARRAFLEVRAGNREARALYDSCGFVPAGLRHQYYRHPTEDAVLLVRPDLESPGGFLRSR